MYPIIEVDSRKADELEQLGTKAKFWYANRSMLFKAEERGTGEDWAEKIACELCELLGLPHVKYELAYDVAKQVPGVVCPTCAPLPTWALGLGNQLLHVIDPRYPDGTKYKVKGHTIDAVVDVLLLLAPTPMEFNAGLPAGIATALDIFCGYVMLDAWIANQDRHHENWGALLKLDEKPKPRLHLAPTFDHGASLARNVLDEEKRERLASNDRGRQMPAFARRARSAFYVDAGDLQPLKTHAAFGRFAQRAPNGAKIWLEQLEKVDDRQVMEILDRVPPQRMSHVSREFTRSLLNENRVNLLNGETE